MKRWDAILKRIPEGELTGAEVGVWKGNLSHRLLRARPRLTLHMVDRWNVPPKDQTLERNGLISDSREMMLCALETAMDVTRFAGERAVIQMGESVKVAKKFTDNSLDFVFIDGDHSREGVLSDLEAWAGKVRPSGWLCGHDWGYWGVTDAVREFFTDIRSLMWGELQLDCDHTWFRRRII